MPTPLQEATEITSHDACNNVSIWLIDFCKVSKVDLGCNGERFGKEKEGFQGRG